MARRKPPVIADAVVDQLLAGADTKTAFDKDGLLGGDCQKFCARAGFIMPR